MSCYWKDKWDTDYEGIQYYAGSGYYEGDGQFTGLIVKPHGNLFVPWDTQRNRVIVGDLVEWLLIDIDSHTLRDAHKKRD